MDLIDSILMALTIRIAVATSIIVVGSFFILACCYLGFAITLYITKKIKK